jgi:hypothetical protein
MKEKKSNMAVVKTIAKNHVIFCDLPRTKKNLNHQNHPSSLIF